VRRVLACALILVLAGCGAAPQPGVTTLLYASPYGPNHPFSVADQTWMHWVEAHSNGSLRIRPIWSGALISADQPLIELRHGVADIGTITPIYVRGGVQLIRIQSGFYAGARTVEEQVALYQCVAAAEPEYARELAGLKVLAVQGGTLPGILTRTRPVQTLTDLKGLRIRAPTEMLELLRDLGADPVNMPMGEVYSALAKGVLDGVVAPKDALRSMHLSEVAKYFTEFEVPRGAYPARAMGERRWRTLTPEQQQVLTDAEPIWEAALAQQIRATVNAGQMQGQHDGVKFYPVSAAEQQQFDDLYREDALRNAQDLERFGIDGPEVLARAQTLAKQLRDQGVVSCNTPAAAPEVKSTKP
jgi:TRAP-type C4-dicarboxylate transport system substrate-binding protein